MRHNSLKDISREYNCHSLRSSEFEQPVTLFGTTTFYGAVADIERKRTNSSPLHRLLRSLRYGEPYQLNRSKYGAVCSYTCLHVDSLDGSGRSREIICCNDRLNVHRGTEVKINVSICRRSGTCIGNHIHIISTGRHLNARGLSLPAAVIRILTALILTAVLFIIYRVAA